MRYHEPFTLLPRKMSSGLTVYYYRGRTEDGRRTVAWSTGQTKIGKAREHCRNLEKAGTLIPRRDSATSQGPFIETIVTPEGLSPVWKGEPLIDAGTPVPWSIVYVERLLLLRFAT